MMERAEVADGLGSFQQSRQRRSLLMELPSEIRCEIFRHLLSTKYTKRPLGYYDDTLGLRWIHSKPQPHHYYEFHTSILFVNKKIYQEAAYIFYNENLFVLVSIDELCVSEWKGLLSAFIERCGVPVMARKRQAREFQHHAMELYIAYRFDTSVDQEQKKLLERTDFIVAGDDLSLLCKSYVKFGPYTNKMEYGTRLRRAVTRLEVLEGKSQSPLATLRAVHKPATYERRLLEPFRRLHSHSSVEINGAVSAEYKSEILFEMMKAPQIADDLLHSMTIAQSQAEDQFHYDKLELACRTYQTVIEDVEKGFEWPPKSGCTFQCPEMGASRCRNAICLAELNVRNRLSEIYLTLQRPDQVRQWTNSALSMLRIHDNDTDAGGNKILGAKLFYRLAWASHQMGVRCRALDEIWRARNQDPDNDVYKRIQQDWAEEEAQQPHEHGGNYPEACKGFWLRRNA